MSLPSNPFEPVNSLDLVHQIFGIEPMRPHLVSDDVDVSVPVIPIRQSGEKVLLHAVAEELQRADRAPVLFQADRAQADHDCLEELRTLLEAAGYYKRPTDDGQIDWTVNEQDLEDTYGCRD